MPRHVRGKYLPYGIIGVFWRPGALLSFLRSFHHPKPLHLWYLNMSGASVLAGAHHFVASNNMDNTANAVSRMVII